MADADDARISDETLVGRAAAGDDTAFHRLVRRHQAAVYRFAQAAGPPESRLEEVLAEVFSAARRGVARFRDEPSARPWLFALARQALDRRHPRAASPSSSLRELARAAAGAPEWNGSPDSPGAVAAALAALPPEDREILTLYDRERLTIEETARVTGLAGAAVRTRLHRARLRLLAEIKERTRA
jgi:RNA polymerase sigma-70 factor (ECF subfamily)